jgi:hypothetical protein
MECLARPATHFVGLWRTLVYVLHACNWLVRSQGWIVSAVLRLAEEDLLCYKPGSLVPTCLPACLPPACPSARDYR